ncbi:MAG: hypothetical protein KF720_21815 [Rubrivivax sp.]|nr:hypothetical protein [Rubrivivax sp.]
MKLATGKVVGGKVVVEGAALAEGSYVTVLAREADESFEISPELAAELDIALSEEARGESIPLNEALRRLRSDASA